MLLSLSFGALDATGIRACLMTKRPSESITIEGEIPPYRPTAKWAFSVRVWAAVGRNGRTPLLRIPKS